MFRSTLERVLFFQFFCSRVQVVKGEEAQTAASLMVAMLGIGLGTGAFLSNFFVKLLWWGCRAEPLFSLQERQWSYSSGQHRTACSKNFILLIGTVFFSVLKIVLITLDCLMCPMYSFVTVQWWKFLHNSISESRICENWLISGLLYILTHTSRGLK